MKSIANSLPCYKSELDVFSLPPTNTSIDEGGWSLYYPLTSTEGGPLEFQVAPSDNEYLILPRTYLYMVLAFEASPSKPLKKETSESTEKAQNEKEIREYEEELKKICPINNIGSSIFSHIDVVLKG